MLEFPADYFEREVQDGHLVGQLIKRAWAVQLDLLDKIDGICKKHNLTYFAYWGTLIGAVRHQGFIPWDDDLDIAMPRPDYMKFLEVVMDELPEEFRLINNYVANWANSFSRIVKGNSLYLSDEELERNYNCPFFLGIDIFPLDYLSRNKRESEEQQKIMRHIGLLLTVIDARKEEEEKGSSVEKLSEYNESIASSLVMLEKMCGIRFEGDVPLAKQLNILYDQIAALFTEEESDYLTDFPNYYKHGYVVKKEWFQNIERVPFEKITIPVPMGYDSILRKSHGDYTVRVRGKSTHGDIYFRPQIKLLAERLDTLVKEEIPLDKQTTLVEEAMKKRCVAGKEKVCIFVCNDTYETIASEVSVVKKLRAVFDEFEGRDDVFIWWRPCRIDSSEMSIVEKILPRLVEEYRELVKEFEKKELGFLDPGVNISFALDNCNAYYGVENKISRVFQLTNKPVMIMSFETGI